MKPLSKDIVNNIIHLLDAGQSAKKIAKELHVSIGSVSNLRKHLRPDLPKSKGGRPLKLDDTTIRHAVRLITSGKVDTATQATKMLQNTSSGTFSVSTMRRKLKSVGLKSMVKKKRPILSARHRRERLDFAQAHEHWTLEDWKKVVWSDETKINRLGSDGRKWTWRRAGEPLSDRLVEGTLKFGGGSLMFWGCMCWEGVGYGVKIDGKMDAELYTSILEDELMESLKWWNKEVEDILFQQDNDPKHTSKKAQEWFKDHEIEVMKWPAQSPDLNPIEHLWSHLKRKLGEYEIPPKGIEELWARVQKEWNGIDKAECQKLIASMPARVKEVLKAKGGYTKY